MSWCKLANVDQTIRTFEQQYCSNYCLYDFHQVFRPLKPIDRSFNLSNNTMDIFAFILASFFIVVFFIVLVWFLQSCFPISSMLLANLFRKNQDPAPPMPTDSRRCPFDSANTAVRATNTSASPYRCDVIVDDMKPPSYEEAIRQEPFQVLTTR